MAVEQATSGVSPGPQQTTTNAYDFNTSLLTGQGTSTFWSCKYTYTDFDKVLTRTDARGVITTYGYDGLNRLSSVSYNTSNAPGVVATSTMLYTYGTGTQLKSVGACNEFYEGYAYDQYNRLSTLDRFIQGRHYQSAYLYNQLGQRTQTNDPGGVLSLQYDNQARLQTVGSYLTSTTYNPAGQVTGFTLGNGVTESFGYDANRLQLITFNATAPGGPFGGLMQLSYVYQAAAGQSGAGTTAGNAGQLTSMFGTIGGIPEGASYSYDLVNRLATSYTGTSNQSAYRRYAYDRWGNRTGVWDAVSGGNQIQSVALEMSGGAPMNRIQSVTAGATFNYFYDLAGNVINDGTHGYTYDAENRLVSIDGGAMAQYLYDHKNRRVLKQVGTAKTDYLWDGDRVVEEHDGSTSNAGALLVRYIYSGSDMIAKVESGVTRYFLRDKLSVRLMLDSSAGVIGRQAHLPFGEDFAESGTQEKHHFTSYERNAESGNDYAVNRYYESITGRFYSTDPISDRARTAKSPGCGEVNYGSETSRPQSWDKYNYTENDPINRTDPSGLLLAWGEWSGFCPAEYSTEMCVILGRISNPFTGGGGGGGGGGIDGVGAGISITMYRYERFERVGGGYFNCIYKQDCSVYNSRSICGHGEHHVITNNLNRCRPWVKTIQFWVEAFGEIICSPIGKWDYTFFPEPCT